MPVVNNHRSKQTGPAQSMRMRLMLLGGGNALGQALIRLGAEEDIGFLAPKPPQDGWDAASLTQLLDDTRPDALINLAYYFDWFQAEAVSETRLAGQEFAIERLAELCQHHSITLLQPSSYRVFDGSRATAYSEKDEPVPWACAARRCGVSNKACALRARSMCCCGLAGCSMTASTARSDASWPGPRTPTSY